MNKILAERAQSGFPVSVGTSLALESLFSPIQEVIDETRQVPNKIDTTTYNNYIFNISTLLRNLLNSIPFSKVLILSKKDILDTLLEEIEWLNNFFQLNKLIVSFYINTYQFVKNTYGPKGNLRTCTTDKQIYLDGIYRYCLDKLIKEDDVDVFSNDIKYNKEDVALVMTHIPWDLLSYRNFIKLDLLESHTGVVKTRKNWNTKYIPVPNKDMSFLPFQEYLLTIFGDMHMFKPASLAKRMELYDVLKKRNVNPLTDDFSLSLLIK